MRIKFTPEELGRTKALLELVLENEENPAIREMAEYLRRKIEKAQNHSRASRAGYKVQFPQAAHEGTLEQLKNALRREIGDSHG